MSNKKIPALREPKTKKSTSATKGAKTIDATSTQNTPAKKKKDALPFFKVLKYYTPLKWRIIALFVIGLVGIYIYSIIPSYQKTAINHLDSQLELGLGPELKFVLKALIFMMTLEIVNEIFAFFCVILITRYEGVITTKLVGDMKHKLDTVPTAFLSQFASGDLSRRVAHNAADLMKNVLMTVYKFARVSFFYVSTSIMMFNIDVTLALIVISSLPACILTARFVSSKTQKHFKNYAVSSASMTTYVDQKILLHEFYRMHGINNDTSDFDEANRRLSRGQIGEDVATAFNTIYITFINNFYYLLITVVCGIFFLQGTLVGFGALPLFLTYSKRFLDNATVITELTNVVQVIGSRAARVFPILEYPEDVTEKEHIDIKKISGDIVFDKVTYIENQEKMLDRVSFTIPSGASVAFVGPTGGGKSSVVNILAKLAVPTEGRILVDNVNLSEITSHSYHERTGIAFETPFLFRGTVAENILYGIGRALPENVMKTAKKLGIHSFIETLPKGYETELSENTALLTSSQKQAINVARTVLESPDLVIISEAYSHADIMSEKQLYEQIMNQDKKRTTIFVTHRLASIQKCDIIFYMENGRVREQGTHAELMRAKRKYYKAFTS